MTRPQLGDDPAFVRALRIMEAAADARRRIVAKGWGR